MKAKKKPLGMKHKIREERKREERIGLAFIATILIVIIFISGFIINSMLNQPSTSQTFSSTSEPKAAIVDHLSLTYPNQTFTQTATNTLEQAGYTVDYYRGEEVTVEFYRNLPTHGYNLIILRVHFGFVWGSGDMGLFTSELYSTTKHVYEQLTDQVQIAVVTEGEPKYFGITQGFVKQSMKGKFSNATVIMMGCNGLTYTNMARAFIEKGAKVYISWNASVQASHTDQTTAHLLQHLLIKKQTIKEGVKQTMQKVGPDPAYKSALTYYPLEAGDYTIQSIISNLVTNSIEIKHKEPLENKILQVRFHSSFHG